MTLLKEFEQDVQVVIEHLNKCADIISRLYTFKNGRITGLPNAGRKARHALDLYLTVSSPPELQLQRMLKWLVRDLPNVKVELENQYYDIVRDSVDITNISDEVVLGKQLSSLELKIRKLSEDLTYYVKMAKEAEQQNKTKKPTKTDGDKAKETETPEQPITLKNFIKTYCDLSERPDIDSKCEMLMRECRLGRIKLPLVKAKYRKGQRKLYYPDKLLKNWPTYRITLTTLPPLKKSGNK